MQPQPCDECREALKPPPNVPCMYCGDGDATGPWFHICPTCAQVGASGSDLAKKYQGRIRRLMDDLRERIVLRRSLEQDLAAAVAEVVELCEECQLSTGPCELHEQMFGTVETRSSHSCPKCAGALADCEICEARVPVCMGKSYPADGCAFMCDVCHDAPRLEDEVPS